MDELQQQQQVAKRDLLEKASGPEPEVAPLAPLLCWACPWEMQLLSRSYPRSPPPWFPWLPLSLRSRPGLHLPHSPPSLLLLTSPPSCFWLILIFPPFPQLPQGVRDISNAGNLPIMNTLAKLHNPPLHWFISFSILSQIKYSMSRLLDFTDFCDFMVLTCCCYTRWVACQPTTLTLFSLRKWNNIWRWVRSKLYFTIPIILCFLSLLHPNNELCRRWECMNFWVIDKFFIQTQCSTFSSSFFFPSPPSL